MIDLAALFQEATAQHAAQNFPAFPTSATPAAETQVSHDKHISGISGIGKRLTGEPKKKLPRRVCARVRASAREMYPQKCRKCRKRLYRQGHGFPTSLLEN